MAEVFFNDTCTSSLSRTFEDFEKEWRDMRKDFEVVFDSGQVCVLKVSHSLTN
jgi:hypothetical protein